MKKVYTCIVVLALLIGYAAGCQIYVSGSINRTVNHLENAAQGRIYGDYDASRAHAIAAQEEWHKLLAKSDFLLADLTIAPEVTVSLSRVSTLAATESTDNRFYEEKNVAILLLRHFLSDNQD